MKKLLTATAALAALSVGVAKAADTQVIATVTAICEVNIQPDLLADFGIDPVAGGTFDVVDAIQFNCNDGDGATVELRSSEGHLESDDNEDQGVDYRVGLITAASPVLVLNADTGANDTFVSQNYTNAELNAGGGLATLVFDLLEAPTLAGGYSDTLAVEIQAN